MKTRFTVLLVFSSLLLSAGIVSETPETLSYHQSNGETVTVHKRPERAVVLHISLTGMWYAAGGKAVARPHAPRLRVLPEAARNLPDVGDYYNPDMEKLLSFRPDLVLLHSKRGKHWEIQKLLRAAGVESVCVDYANYDDFLNLLGFFARLNGNPPEALSLQKRITEEVDALCRRTESMPALSFICMIATGDGFLSETPRGNTANMAARLGARNVVPEASPVRIKYSMEQLILADPDVIFLLCTGRKGKHLSGNPATLDKRTEWRNLKAVKSNRVYGLEAETFLYLPGERYPEAFRKLAVCLYPEITMEKSGK